LQLDTRSPRHSGGQLPGGGQNTLPPGCNKGLGVGGELNSAGRPPGDWGCRGAEALQSGTGSGCPYKHPNWCGWYEVGDDEQGMFSA